MSLAPGMQEPAIRPAQLRYDEVERGARCLQPFRLAEYRAGARERGDGQAVPVGQHLVVAAGLWTRLAQGEELRARRGEAGLLLGRSARRDATQHIAVFP